MLNGYVAELKKAILADLQAGRVPSQGTYDSALLKECQAKGSAQMGATRFTPTNIILEYVFASTIASNSVFTVTVNSPSRIVFLPIPEWVVENIWQGDITGSYHFEEDANRLYSEFGKRLEPAANVAEFEPRRPTHRE